MKLDRRNFIGSSAAIAAALSAPTVMASGKPRVVVIGGGATLNGHLVEKGNLVLEKIIVGKNSTVGGATMVGPGARIGENSILGNRAVLAKRKVIPDGEIWVGIPARPISSLQSDASK